MSKFSWLLLAGLLSLAGSAAFLGSVGTKSRTTPPVETTKISAGGVSASSKLAEAHKIASDPTAFRDFLRAQGFDDEVIFLSVRSLIWLNHDRRQREIASKVRGSGREYWQKPSRVDEGFTKAERQELRELSNGARTMTIAVLGRDSGDLSLTESTALFSFLPKEKAIQLKQIERDYADLRNQILGEAKLIRTPTDEANLRLLAVERNQDLEKLLSPQELQDYPRRNSPTAVKLQQVFAMFSGSEAEYNGVYDIQSAFDKQFAVDSTWNQLRAGQVPFESKSDPKAKAAAEEQLYSHLKSFLGDERYASFLQAQQPDYQALRLAADRFNLSPDVVANVYNARAAALDLVKQISADSATSLDDKKKALSTLAQSLKTSIASAMGEEAAAAYSNAALRWMPALERGLSVSIKNNGDVYYTLPTAKSPLVRIETEK